MVTGASDLSNCVRKLTSQQCVVAILENYISSVSSLHQQRPHTAIVSSEYTIAGIAFLYAVTTGVAL